MIAPAMSEDDEDGGDNGKDKREEEEGNDDDGYYIWAYGDASEEGGPRSNAQMDESMIE
jgi:hypothetical protein